MHDYVISARRVRKGKFIAEPGPVLFLKVPGSSSEALPEHRVTGRNAANLWIDEVRGLADGDENPNSISPRGDVLVFVHGYNNDARTIIGRHRQLNADLREEGWKGIVVSFDWPCDDDTLNYLEDRWDGAAVAQMLVSECVRRIAVRQTTGCITNIHLLGHSTGAYVIMEAFAQAEKDGDLFKSNWRVGQVAFIGGDVSAHSVSAGESWSQPMFQRIMRLTNYANPFDAVLGVSNAKRLGTSPRIGRVGLPQDHNSKATNVNCGPYFKTLDPKTAKHFGSWTHSWHIGNPTFARDLAMTLEGAIDRNAIPTRETVDGNLILVDRPRPAYQAAIVTKPPLRVN